MSAIKAELNGNLVKRSDKVAYYGIPGVNNAVTYTRMQGFTETTKSKNPIEYSRQYVDESFERSDVTGYSTAMSFAFDQYKDNLKYLTELVLVLNIKIFIWYKEDDDLGLTYDQLWKETDQYALETLKGDDLHYYLHTLD